MSRKGTPDLNETEFISLIRVVAIMVYRFHPSDHNRLYSAEEIAKASGRAMHVDLDRLKRALSVLNITQI
jgi:tRNA A37 N6-isopentenylltransferase MiaA